MLSIDFSFKMKRELSGEGDLVGSVDDSIKIGSALWTIKKDLLSMK